MNHQEPNALVCVPGSETQYSCQRIYSLARADEHGYSQFFSEFHCPLPSQPPTQLFSLSLVKYKEKEATS